MKKISDNNGFLSLVTVIFMVLSNVGNIFYDHIGIIGVFLVFLSIPFAAIYSWVKEKNSYHDLLTSFFYIFPFINTYAIKEMGITPSISHYTLTTIIILLSILITVHIKSIEGANA